MLRSWANLPLTVVKLKTFIRGLELNSRLMCQRLSYVHEIQFPNPFISYPGHKARLDFWVRWGQERLVEVMYPMSSCPLKLPSCDSVCSLPSLGCGQSSHSIPVQLDKWLLISQFTLSFPKKTCDFLHLPASPSHCPEDMA